MFATAHILETPNSQLFVGCLPWSPPMCLWNITKSDLYPSVNQLRGITLTAPAPQAQLPRTPATHCSDLRCPCLGLCCLQLWSPADPASQSHIPAFDLVLPKDLCLAKVQLIHPGHHQCYQSAQDHDSFTVSCKVERKTFIPSLSPSDGRSHSMVPWARGDYKVYCSTCLFIHPAPILQGMDKCPQGAGVGGFQTQRHVPETSTVSGGRNNTQHAELAVWFDWPSHIYPFIPQ